MISRTYARQKALSYKNLAILLGRLVIIFLNIKMHYICDLVNEFLKNSLKKLAVPLRFTSGRSIRCSVPSVLRTRLRRQLMLLTETI